MLYTMMMMFLFTQDNIKDKMRSIPFEVSVEIVGTKRQRTKNSLPQLLPILDSSQPSKEVTEVNIQTTTCIMKLMIGCRQRSKVCDFLAVAGQLCERGMWRYLPK